MSIEVSHHDVVVVGARCAGAATARLLAQDGIDVALVDRAALPSDTLSTHGIARGGVVQLSRWGLLDDVVASGAPPARHVTFGFDGDETKRLIKERAGVDMLIAPRRQVLDSLLADAAVRAGASLHASTKVSSLVRDPAGRVQGVLGRTSEGVRRVLFGRHVVGADGLRSSVGARVGAADVAGFEADVSLFYAYMDGVDWDGFEFHVGPQSYAGVFPTHDGQACVWLSRPTHLLTHLRSSGAGKAGVLIDAIAEGAPSLGDRLRAGRVVSTVRGIVAPPNYVRQAHGPGWALVGDAGYHRDPITGHGITDAFRDAELLAGALALALDDTRREQEHLADYQAQRDEALAETFELTRALCRFPEPHRFVELQMQLSAALDREATQLASRPAPAGLSAALSA